MFKGPAKKAFIVVGRAVGVTESDQRHRKATVLWWISIFKAGRVSGMGLGGLRRRKDEAAEPHWLCSSQASQKTERPSKCASILFPPLFSWVHWASALGVYCVTLAGQCTYNTGWHARACWDLLHDRTPKDSYPPPLFFWSSCLHAHTCLETHTLIPM